MIVTVQQAKSYFTITGTSEDARLEFITDAADAAIKAKAGIDLEQTDYPGAAVGGYGDSGYYCGTGSRFLFTRQTPINSIVLTGTTAIGSTTVSSLSSSLHLFADQTITGVGIPGGTTISSVGASSLVLSQAATAAGTVTLTVGPAVYEDLTGRFGMNPDGSFATANLLVAGTDYVWHQDGCLPGSTVKCSYGGKIERLNTYWYGLRVAEGGNLNRNVGDAPGTVKIVYTAGFPTLPGDIVKVAFDMIAWMRLTYANGGRLESERFEDYSYVRGKADQYIQMLGTAANLIGRYKRRLVA